MTLRMRTSVPWSDGFRCPTKRVVVPLCCLRACFLGSQRQGGASCYRNRGWDWLKCAASSLDEHTTRGRRGGGRGQVVTWTLPFKSVGPGSMFKIQDNVGWRIQQPQRGRFVGDGESSQVGGWPFFRGSWKAGPRCGVRRTGSTRSSAASQGTAAQGNSVQDLKVGLRLGPSVLDDCPLTEQSIGLDDGILMEELLLGDDDEV